LFWKPINGFSFDIPGLKDEEKSSRGNNELVEGLMQTILISTKNPNLKKIIQQPTKSVNILRNSTT
jgi:hypothetical protein